MESLVINRFPNLNNTRLIINSFPYKNFMFGFLMILAGSFSLSVFSQRWESGAPQIIPANGFYLQIL
jgi:hypothetical protein